MVQRGRRVLRLRGQRPGSVHLQPGRRHPQRRAVQRVRNSADQHVLEACHRARRRGGRRGQLLRERGRQHQEELHHRRARPGRRCQPGDDDGVLVRHRIALRPGGRHGRAAVGRGGDGRPGRRREHHHRLRRRRLRPAAALALRAGEERASGVPGERPGAGGGHRVEPSCGCPRPWRATSRATS